MLGELRFLNKIVRSNFDLLDRPYKLIYSVTKECHSRCSNCNIWKTTPSNELTLDEIERFAKNTSFISWLNLTGGEPTDRPDFVEVVAAFIKWVPDLALINFPTNGINTARIVEKCERLAALGPPKLVVAVSIDGPPEINDRLRGIKNDFRCATKTLRELRKIRGIDTIVGMTLYDDNHDSIEATITAIQAEVPEFSRRELHINIATNSAHLYGNQETRYERQSSVVTSAERLMATKRTNPFDPMYVLENGFLKRIRGYYETGRTPIPCSALKSSVYLSETGEIHPCTVWSRSLGNIRDHGYSLAPALRDGPETPEIRKSISKKDCPNCWSPCEASQSILDQLLRSN